MRLGLALIACAALAPMALACAAPSYAQEAEENVEQALAMCIYEKDAGLLVDIRDAASQEDFEAALMQGAVLCEMTEFTQFSMGKFFDAIAELIGPPEYEQ